MAWRLAGSPTRRSPLSVKATTLGVRRLPSWLGMTLTSPPSRTATTEFVVPRSMPMIFSSATVRLLSERHRARPRELGASKSWRRRGLVLRWTRDALILFPWGGGGSGERGGRRDCSGGVQPPRPGEDFASERTGGAAVGCNGRHGTTGVQRRRRPAGPARRAGPVKAAAVRCNGQAPHAAPGRPQQDDAPELPSPPRRTGDAAGGRVARPAVMIRCGLPRAEEAGEGGPGVHVAGGGPGDELG